MLRLLRAVPMPLAVCRRWVGEECCRRVAADYEGQRKLINYGLRETARQARPPAAEDADDQVGRWGGVWAVPESYSIGLQAW